jgi:hypothetical protein
VLPSGQKLTLDLLATINLEAVPFRAYAPSLAFLQFFKCILEVMFCEGVQHHLQFCFSHIISVKTADFQFLSSIREREKVGWMGDDSYVVFDQKFPGEKGSVTVHYCDATASSLTLLPKFRVKSLHIFTQSP